MGPLLKNELPLSPIYFCVVLEVLERIRVFLKVVESFGDSKEDRGCFGGSKEGRSRFKYPRKDMKGFGGSKEDKVWLLLIFLPSYALTG